MDQKKTGYFLKQLRNEKKLTQEQLAEKADISVIIPPLRNSAVCMETVL